MKFRHCLFKILKNQNVAGGRTDMKTVPVRCAHTVCEWYKNVNVVYLGDLESQDQSATLLGDVSKGLFDVIKLPAQCLCLDTIRTV